MSKSNEAEVISTSSHPIPANAKKAAQRPSATVSFEDEDPDTPAVPPLSRPPDTRESFSQANNRSNRVQTKTTAEHSPDQLTLHLPSKFLFYPFKELSAGNVRGKHQAKFAAAAKNQSTRITVEAVSSLLGDNVSASMLTIPDFYFVMYQLRLNSAGMVPLKVRSICSDPEHVLAVAEKKKDRQTLVNETFVNASQLEETELNEQSITDFLGSEAVQNFTEQTGLLLDAPRMADSLELEEKWLGKPEYDEIEFLADLAGSVRPAKTRDTADDRLSLEDRIRLVGELNPEQIQVLQEWQELTQSYGVEEKVTTKCKECSAEIVTEVSVSAHSFL